MKNKMISSGEAYVVNFNLRQIEKNLGHSVPGGLIDHAELTQVLSPGEVNRICFNVREIEKHGYSQTGSYRSYSSPRNHSIQEKILADAIVGAIILVMYILSLFFK